MPIGVALVDLRRDLRAETGQSLNAAQGVQSQATQDNQLDRQQRELWEAYDWPHLRYWRDVPVNAGQDTYAYPPDMPFDSVNTIHYAQTATTQWKPLGYGLHGYQLRPSQPTQGTPQRWGNMVSVDPVSLKTDPVGQIKLLPIPVGGGTLRLEGQAPCNPLVADDDTCIIDSKCIVLFAAAEILATQKVEAAQLKLQKAQNYLRRLLANQSADKRRDYNLGGRYHNGYLGRTPYIDYIPS